MKRYYHTKKGAKVGGIYKIIDRTLDSRIATCDFKENADLIVRALNILAEGKFPDSTPSAATVSLFLDEPVPTLPLPGY